ncbi:MAG: hypothetical protein SFU98_19520 [Leptospiraceae bacterium]|nr:hypothetical protein [Leptospiraceae bacterium]
MKILLCSIFISISIWGETKIPMRNVTHEDYRFTPFKQEGYFQGWNYSFHNSEYTIFVTSLISNMAPNDLNHGIAVSIESKKTGSYFITKEYGEKDLVANRSVYYVKNFNHIFEEKENEFLIQVNAEEVKLNLSFKPKLTGPNLSGGRYKIEGENFVQADIPFSFADAEGYLELKGEKIILKGQGSMEHLLTNYEVYNFSTRWEMFRAISKEGNKVFTGGYLGKNGAFFRTISIQDKNGKILLGNRILKTVLEKTIKDSFSGYELPVVEKIFLDNEMKCSATITNSYPNGRINVLANISVVLRYFINLFIAKPFIINYSSSIELDCAKYFKNKMIFQGFNSYYLINPK